MAGFRFDPRAVERRRGSDRRAPRRRAML